MNSSGGSIGKKLTDHVPPAVVITDEAGIIRSANVPALVLFGYSVDELVGRSISSLMPEAVVDHRYFEKETSHATTTRVVVGTSKGGLRIKLRVAFSYMTSGDSSLVCAMMVEVADRCFFVTADQSGTILKVVGNSSLTTGYTSQSLLGMNVFALCPNGVAAKHASYMAGYKVGADSTVVGHVRSRELRHVLGYLVPISLSVHVIGSDPIVFSACITEIEKSTEAVLTANLSGRIVGVSSGSVVFFGFEENEFLEMEISVVVPGFVSKVGKCFVNCRHKDGSHFFAAADVTSIFEDDIRFWHVSLDRAQLGRVARQRSILGEYGDTLFCGDLLDWYEITKKVLGSGLFGEVKVATHRLTGVNVAIKTLRKKQYEDVGLLYPPREVDMLKKLHHPNILRFFHSVATD
jgi:PAS domain S-box-containing protein